MYTLKERVSFFHYNTNTHMKTRLPKALLVAVLSSTMAFGAGSYVTTEIIKVSEADEIKLSEDSAALGYLTASTTDPDSKFYLNFDQKNQYYTMSQYQICILFSNLNNYKMNFYQ